MKGIALSLFCLSFLYQQVFAFPCEFFEKSVALSTPEAFVNYFKEKVLPLNLDLLSAQKWNLLNAKQKKALENWSKRTLEDLRVSKTQKIGDHIDEIIALLNPRGPQSISETEKLHFEKMLVWNAVVTELQHDQLISEYVPRDSKLKSAQTILKFANNAVLLSLGFEYRVVLPFLKTINTQLDPISNPEVKKLLEKAEKQGWEAARYDFYRLMRKSNPYVRDPVQFEFLFNKILNMYNHKLLALAVLGLRIYFLQTAPNETASDIPNQQFASEVQKVQSQDDAYFQEQLKALGIDAVHNPEEYREAYRQYYGREAPANP